MQTFLPYTDFTDSARVLDNKRLGKQRVECLQLLNALLNPDPSKKGWKNHPAKEMWKGYENSLVEYAICICEVWIARGFKDTCLSKAKAYFNPTIAVIKPVWLGDDRLHSSHRSNLLRKNYEFYSKHQWKEGPDLPYMWPSVNTDGSISWRAKHSAISQYK